VFKGTAREAARGFPANLNVAVALSLAGIGPDKTTLEIWADPTVTRNTHRIVVDSDAARLDMMIENIPSENPKTGRITALSVISILRKLNAALRVGFVTSILSDKISSVCAAARRTELDDRPWRAGKAVFHAARRVLESDKRDIPRSHWCR